MSRNVLRAVGWKEWREQRPLLLAGLATSAMLPVLLIAGAAAMRPKPDYEALSESMLFILVALVWPLFAAAAGAGTIASEIGEGTLGFLLSRPVSRARLWFVKVLLAGVTVALIVAGSMGMVWVFGSVTGSQGLMEIIPGIFDYDLGTMLNPIVVPGAILILFASATLFSTFLTRALTAAAAGIGLSLGLLVAMFLFWSRLDLEFYHQPELLAVQLLVAGVFILGASLYLFARGEMKPDRLRALIVLLAIPPVLAFLFLPVVHAFTRLTPATAYLDLNSMSLSGDALAVTALREDGLSSQVWLVHTDGTGMRRLTPRLTMEPVLSPDGNWVAYLSSRSSLGLRADSLSLLVMRADGSESRLLVNDLQAVEDHYWDVPRPVFSPDMKWVVLQHAGQLIFARMDGKETFRVDLYDTPTESAYMVGWTADGTELLLLSRYGVAAVWAAHPETRRVRRLYEGDQPLSIWPFWNRPSQKISRVPLLLESELEGAPKKLVLLDLEKMSVESVHNSVCVGSLDYLEEKAALAYSACTGSYKDGSQSEIWVRDVTSGDERRLASFEGRAWALRLSPAADRVVARANNVAQNTDHSWVAIFGPEGRIRTVPSEWFHIGWSGRNRVVLADRDVPTRIALADADSSILTTVHPQGY